MSGGTLAAGAARRPRLRAGGRRQREPSDRHLAAVAPAYHHAMRADITARASWLRRIGPWVGIGTSPAVLMMGGGVAQGIEGPLLMAAIGVGVVALGILAAAQGLIGQRTGRPLLALSAEALG